MVFFVEIGGEGRHGMWRRLGGEEVDGYLNCRLDAIETKKKKQEV